MILSLPAERGGSQGWKCLFNLPSHFKDVDGCGEFTEAIYGKFELFNNFNQCEYYFFFT
jgi:hypothetical protein